MTRSISHEIDADTGVIVLEKHRLNYRLHRDPNEGPAYIERASETGIVLAERYYWQGKLHREDGPAVIRYDFETRALTLEEYYRHGLLHRNPKEGPARVERRWDGFVRVECYSLYGQLYREPADGPYYWDRTDDGKITCKRYSAPNDGPPSGRRPSQRARFSTHAVPSL